LGESFSWQTRNVRAEREKRKERDYRT
jgi:hypothetical protein